MTVLVKSLVAVTLIAGILGVGAYSISQGTAAHGDEVSRADREARLAAFNALPPLHLSAVLSQDEKFAEQGMQLPAAAINALDTNLEKFSFRTVQAVKTNALGQPNASTSSPPLREPSVRAKPERANSESLRLVWITLWDTDVEDGDIVRIDSHGYSRTVRLTKKGETFAIPVTNDDTIRVTGVSDGDGGGITVGLASGGVRAIFPIMSEGQVLGLRVQVN